MYSVGKKKEHTKISHIQEHMGFVVLLQEADKAGTLSGPISVLDDRFLQFRFQRGTV